jgi:hypothetical protein
MSRLGFEVTGVTVMNPTVAVSQSRSEPLKERYAFLPPRFLRPAEPPYRVLDDFIRLVAMY